MIQPATSYSFGNAALRGPLDLGSLPSSVRFTDGERRVFQSRERDPLTGRPLTVSQYSERHRVVTTGKLPGLWQNIYAPYAVLPMDLWTHPTVREIYLCFAPQIVKTQVAFNCMTYSVDQAPGPIMYVMPDEKVAARIMKKRILPMLKACPRTAALLSPYDYDTTRNSIVFTNGASLMMAWATSVAELSSEEARYYIGDEVSKWPGYAAGQNRKEASPIDLLRARANSYTYSSKGLFLSSPGEDPCAISDLIRYDADQTMRFKVPCPACNHEQIMDDEHIVILHNVSDFRRVARENLARYACDKCGMYWNDHMRILAVRRGKWVPGQFDEDGEWHESAREIENPIAVAFHLPSWYNVNMPLSDLKGPAVAKMRQYESPEKKQVFFTQHRAERYKEVIETKKESRVLEEHRTELPAGVVPASALALVCSIDSHTWGYRYAVYAAIEDQIGFTIQKIQHGHVGTLADVEKLVYHSRFPVENSADTMGIFRAAIDTGGSKAGPDATDQEKTMTSEIYDWLRKQPVNGIITGVKGASRQQERGVKLTTIDVYPHSNKPIPGGLHLRLIDTARFKAWFHWRLTRGPGETQRFLMDADTDNDFVRELLAEEQKKQRGRIQWVKVRSANHYLDCTVYALAMIDGEWQPSLKIMASYIKQQRQAVQPKAQDQPTTAPQRDMRDRIRDRERPSWMDR
ncbi:MAG: Phage terminase large subunit (GpA) [Syntrophorhabdus sp. PtaU1.Bin153]|nr:MAG: Phage terminase large subunit (GpA) [Syntrophorhabdus sp. PtaU1.Bin153]